MAVFKIIRLFLVVFIIITLITTKLLDFVLCLFVEIRTMDKVQKLSSNECYTPSSEPFRMYYNTCLEEVHAYKTNILRDP
jgi:hypothetical protein